MPRGMPGARTGRGSSGQGSHSGGNSEDSSGAVTVWEVVSLLGKLLGTVAALKVVLYLLRVCLAMAWKSGGASHSELIHNLRSKCNPLRVWGNWGRPGLDRVPGRSGTFCLPTPCLLDGFRAGLHQQSQMACACDRVSRDLSLIRDVDWKGRERARGRCWWGRGGRLPGDPGGRGRGTGGGTVTRRLRPLVRGWRTRGVNSG